MKEFAVKHRLRWKRDACGDINIVGKWGEIFRYGESMIGVQIGGPRANGSTTRVPPGSNKRINQARRLWGEPSQSGDGEAIFVLSEDRLPEAARITGAYRKRVASPEEAQRLAEMSFRFRPGPGRRQDLAARRHDLAQAKGVMRALPLEGLFALGEAPLRPRGEMVPQAP